MRPQARIAVGSAATWHFRLAGGIFVALVVGELAAQTVRGGDGAGPAGWLLLLGAASWLVGLVWRERVGVARAWLCFAWVALPSLLVMQLAVQRGFLFGPLEFGDRELPRVGPVPLSVPLLWWLVVGGAYLVVEGLWGEMRAGISAFTAVITVQLALMVLPFVGAVRDYWRWPVEPAAGASAAGRFFAVPWSVLAAWLVVALGLSLGLVILGDNWSSADARSRRQAWAPAAVLLGLSLVCLWAETRAGLWMAAAFGAANAFLFGTVVVWYLRERTAPR